MGEGELLNETWAFCTDAVWNPAKQRRKQIRALRARASSNWAKSDVAIWRDLAEYGWYEGGLQLGEDFGWTSVPMRSPRAWQAATKRGPDQVTSGVIAQAVGFVMAVQLAEVDIHSLLPLAFALEDPGHFADTCAALLDDGAKRTAGGGPFIDKSKPSNPRDGVWVLARETIAEFDSTPLDLSARRYLYAPI